MVALPSRQREIVDNQKNPLASKPIITWCANARRTIINFLSDGGDDESILDGEINRLHEKKSNLKEANPKKLESEAKKIQVEIDAINSFKVIVSNLRARNFRFSRASKKPKYLDYSGVHVSVRPEILVTTRKQCEYIGCLKLYLTKNHRLQNEDADFLCAVLGHYTDKYLSVSHVVNPRACIVLDVFGKRAFSASDTVRLHEGKIRKSCEEIRKMWPEIPERKVNNGKNENGEFDF